MYKLIRYNLYLQQQRNVMFVQCMLSFTYEIIKKFKFFFFQCCAYKRLLVCLFVCLFVRVKHGRDYHSMYLSQSSMFNWLLEQIAQLLSFNLFFSFNRLSWIFFLARTFVSWRCVSVTKNKKKEKNGLLTKYCKVSLCLNAVFMKFAYDSHTFPQFMIVIWLLDTVIQYYLKSWNLSKFQINYRLNELTCLYKWCGFFFRNSIHLSAARKN